MTFDRQASRQPAPESQPPRQGGGRKPYSPPVLKEWGTVYDLTGGNIGSAIDFAITVSRANE